MITAQGFKEALRSRIERMTNTLTACDRFEGKGERGYAVLVCERESSIIDGGRQLERCFEISLVIFHSRLEKEDGAMKKRLFDCIFPYFEIADRRFVPLDAKDEKKEGQETITFTVRFCDSFDRENADYELMGNITFNIIGGTDGITADSDQL